MLDIGLSYLFKEVGFVFLFIVGFKLDLVLEVSKFIGFVEGDRVGVI